VTVHVTKRIPDGAGLGGGSSDAAAFLHALDVIFETGLSQERKQAIAGTVGSDVFFFVDGRQNSGTGYEPFCAVVTGRGETIRPVVPRKDLYFILVCPEIHSSTRAAYQLVDDCYHSGMNVMHELLDPLETIYARPVADWTFGNSFTVPLVGAYPCIGDAMQDIASTGADFVQMSGSGSTVFGIFADAADAESAYASLCRKWKKCFLLV
jgi:4-diphosphocytidyl-2-C-methyl-D-erythritol kinase